MLIPANGACKKALLQELTSPPVAMGRKTCASVRKLLKEQKAAEQEASINALQKAKSVYAARGDVNSRGDWLAIAL